MEQIKTLPFMNFSVMVGQY